MAYYKLNFRILQNMFGFFQYLTLQVKVGRTQNYKKTETKMFTWENIKENSKLM